MPGSRVPSVEKILQEVYGDIEEYSRSNKSNMDRSKRSSRRRTDSRYRSGLQKEFKFVYTKSAGKCSETLSLSNISLRNGRTIRWNCVCAADMVAVGLPARPICTMYASIIAPLLSLRIASLNWPACMRRLHTGRAWRHSK